MPRGFGGPFHERLSEERRALPAPMHPGCVAAVFDDWRDPRVLLDLRSRRIAFALCAEGNEEARGKDSASPWQSGKHGEVGMALGALGDGVVEGCYRLQGHTQLGNESLDEEGMRGDDAVISGQYCS